MIVITLLRTLIFKIFFYSFCLLFFPVFALKCVLFGKRNYQAWIDFFCTTSKVLCHYICGITCEYRGIEKLPKDGSPLILLSKHQSYLDPILAFKARNDVTALAKKELFAIPFLGRILKTMDVFKVDRQSNKAHEAMPKVGQDVVDSGRALIIYPEATRVPAGSFRKLKSGAYYLQRDHDLPVYPVSTNAGMFWTKLFWMHPGTAIYEIGDPFPEGLSKAEFMQAAHETVVLGSEALMVEAGFDQEKLPKTPNKTSANG